MKKHQNKTKSNFLKKIFIKICRLIGFEIIDQGTYEIPTLGKKISDSLSSPGKKSITIPLGELNITRKVKNKFSVL